MFATGYGVATVGRAWIVIVTVRSGSANACPVRASVVSRAGIVVVTRCSVWRIRVRTCAGLWITCAGDVTLITRCTRDWIGTDAGSRLARIGLRASIPVGARSAVCCVRVRASSGGRITRPGSVTLIACRASNRIGTCTDSRLTTVALRAGIAIVTRGAVSLRRIRTHSGQWIACTRDMTLIAR